jgi:SAM-dependent methyltransferase
MMKANVPPYFDYLIEGFHQGRSGRFVHLGHWDTPPEADIEMSEDEFQQAQTRLNKFLLNMSDLENALSVLDVGCGFGGTIESINKQYTDMQLVGVNIDTRQLDICQQLKPGNNNSLEWKQADACQLPFPDNSFDRVLCVEAMFHFSSRRKFFKEVARILRPTGNLVASDIVIQSFTPPPTISESSIESAIQQGFGPWPDFWSEDADHGVLAINASLSCKEIIDASIYTLPSYNFTVSGDADINMESSNMAQKAGVTLKWLHKQGHLKYLYLRFYKI